MENYRCESCNMLIPINNRMIHSARCSSNKKIGVSSSGSSRNYNNNNNNNNSNENNNINNDNNNNTSSNNNNDDIVDLTGIIDDEEIVWVCSSCTLTNSEENSYCLACGNRRDNNSSRSNNNSSRSNNNSSRSNNNSSRSNNNSSRSNHSISSDHVEEMWKCPRCTFLNDLMDDHCHMCNTNQERDPSPSFRDVLIPSPPSPPLYQNEDLYRYQNQTRNSSSLRQSVLLGAGVGAGLAWWNGRSISQGAVTGASVGAMSDLLLSHLMNAEEFTNPIPTTRSNMMGMDVDRMSYEQLLENFHSSPRKSSRQVLDNLPVWTCPSSDNNNNNNSSQSQSQSQTCNICLGPFEPGDSLKSLPCLHSYHCECIDTWLSQHHHICPVCKHDVDN